MLLLVWHWLEFPWKLGKTCNLTGGVNSRRPQCKFSCPNFDLINSGSAAHETFFFFKVILSRRWWWWRWRCWWWQWSCCIASYVFLALFEPFLHTHFWGAQQGLTPLDRHLRKCALLHIFSVGLWCCPFGLTKEGWLKLGEFTFHKFWVSGCIYYMLGAVVCLLYSYNWNGVGCLCRG